MWGASDRDLGQLRMFLLSFKDSVGQEHQRGAAHIAPNPWGAEAGAQVGWSRRTMGLGRFLSRGFYCPQGPVHRAPTVVVSGFVGSIHDH